jgi:hypothetical protein
MNQKWFEMDDIRRKKLNKSVWIPLRALQDQTSGSFGNTGYKNEFFGCASLAIPVKQKNATKNLVLHDIDFSNTGYYQHQTYIPSDTYEGETENDLEEDTEKFTGLYLVLQQRITSSELTEWHLHQDFVLTLGLKIG